MTKRTIEDVSDDYRERARLAIARLIRRKEGLTVDRVQDLSGLKRATAAAALRAHRAGQLPDPGSADDVGRWASRPALEGSEGEAEDLVSLVQNAHTEEELRAATRATATALARGTIQVAAANGLEKLLARQAVLLRQAREAPDQEAKAQRVMAGREADALVRAFEGLVSPKRRERVLRFLVTQFNEDLKEFPPIDRNRSAVPDLGTA